MTFTGAPAAIALAVVTGAFLSGCGGASAPVRHDGVAVASYEPSEVSGMDALLTGTVADIDGCLVIRTTDTETGASTDEVPYVPVFATTDPTATTLAIGESVRFGGGAAARAGAGWTVPDACPPDGPFWILPSG